ncbi:plasmid mobilization relaxosome protein MobC [Acuticoccus sp. MNP-M23]|uniref:plasmid mobilization relaxosome protein MobC n=1 Tax=Acuticoccus sp. MNP-M23 TaxID=3072793 RepID=UPI00281625DC|nr:plasmid mobilization relaxosome protein MobC [Acuticoccus sp. MNP-M23]WMS43099.1 plasmid mobilization relaxosome protein MobC [Acuticoccus sp. MNP-M23]
MNARQSFMKSAAAKRQRATSAAPFSLRLSVEERERLECAAGGMPLGTYIRERLFGGDLTPRRTQGRAPVKDHAALGRVLAALGQSRIANNLNQIARLAHLGALPLSIETEEEVRLACRAVQDMRQHLLQALGLRGECL